MPLRYHYVHGTRTGDLLFEGQPGTTFYPRRKDDFNLTGDHGYDYLEENMHAIFFARGPNIRPGSVVQPFQNVELFNLFVDLMRLQHDVPNNGTLGVLDEVLENVQLVRPMAPLPGLEPMRPIQ